MQKITVVVFCILLIYGCSSSSRFTSSDNAENNTSADDDSDTENITSYSNYSVLDTEYGVASYYADEFNGRLTANGEIYDMNGFTAAHPTLPLGTILRVTNLTNKKSIIIRVNDRMPQHPDRIIDLSLGTAKKLGMINSGLAKVKLEVLKWGDNKYKKQR